VKSEVCLTIYTALDDKDNNVTKTSVSVVVRAGLTTEDMYFIKWLRVTKKYSAKCLLYKISWTEDTDQQRKWKIFNFREISSDG